MQKVKVNNLLNTVVISEIKTNKPKSSKALKVSKLAPAVADNLESPVDAQMELIIPEGETNDGMVTGSLFNRQGYQMSRKQKSRIKLLVNYALSKYNETTWKFYTITTCQHLNGLSDIEIAKRFSQVMENLKSNHGLNRYLWVAERQPSTNDLHYHIFCDGDKLDYKKLVPYLNDKFPQTGTNVINGKRVFTNGVSKYLAKYVTKNDVVLHCRPSQVSFEFIADYRLNADDYEQSIELDETSEEFEHILKQCDTAISSFNNEYSTVYYLRPYSTRNVWDTIVTIKSQ